MHRYRITYDDGSYHQFKIGYDLLTGDAKYAWISDCKSTTARQSDYTQIDIQEARETWNDYVRFNRGNVKCEKIT